MTCCICYHDDVPTFANPCTLCKGTAGDVVYCEGCLPNLDVNACPFCRNRPNCYSCPGCKLFRIREGIFCEACNRYLCLNCSLNTPCHIHPIPCTSVWNVCFGRKGFLWKLGFVGMAAFLHGFSPSLVPSFYALVFFFDWPSTDTKYALSYWFMATVMLFGMILPFVPDILDATVLTHSQDFDDSLHRSAFRIIGVIFANSLLFAAPAES